MQQKVKYVSLLIEDMSEGGGLPDDFDFEVIGSKAVDHDFGADKGGKRPCWEITMNAKGYDEPVITYYSIGKATEWMVAPDGNGFVQMISDDQTVNKNSNVGQYIINLGNCGFPIILLNEKGLAAHIGSKGHAKRLPVNNRPEGENAVDSRGQKPKLLVATSITYFEGMDKVASSTSKTTSRSKTKSTAIQQGSNNLADSAIDVVSALLKQEPAGISKADLAKKIFNYARDNKLDNKNEIMSLATTDDFLSDGPWSYANGVVKPIG